MKELYRFSLRLLDDVWDRCAWWMAFVTKQIFAMIVSLFSFQVFHIVMTEIFTQTQTDRQIDRRPQRMKFHSVSLSNQTHFEIIEPSLAQIITRHFVVWNIRKFRFCLVKSHLIKCIYCFHNNVQLIAARSCGNMKKSGRKYEIETNGKANIEKPNAVKLFWGDEAETDERNANKLCLPSWNKCVNTVSRYTQNTKW